MANPRSTDGSCTTLTGNDTAGQTTCNGTFNLAGGQIVIQGVVDTAALFVRNETVPLSIIGGTGRTGLPAATAPFGYLRMCPTRRTRTSS